MDRNEHRSQIDEPPPSGNSKRSNPEEVSSTNKRRKLSEDSTYSGDIDREVKEIPFVDLTVDDEDEEHHPARSAHVNIQDVSNLETGRSRTTFPRRVVLPSEGSSGSFFFTAPVSEFWSATTEVNGQAFDYDFATKCWVSRNQPKKLSIEEVSPEEQENFLSDTTDYKVELPD
eukprot:TRINITY_DN17474_c0_g1_i2.p1 TRINITY_DN17474_c0_g1~~TRINITY_DN17474_c0_g1_i2.p1  ORF type:complete len:173 (+),score=17.63 TRINITY_DN17474_c0_g1_i2:42-560(+)